MMKKNRYYELFTKQPEKIQEIFIGAVMSGNDAFMDAAIMEFDCLDEYKCNSPIEYIFAFAYGINALMTHTEEFLYLEEQKEIITSSGKRYRADFYFTTSKEMTSGYGIPIKARNPLHLVIECDGHAYHETTKQQVKERNERDFNLKQDGIDVLHFSGSQIYNNPFMCVNDVVSYIYGKTGGFVQDDGDL